MSHRATLDAARDGGDAGARDLDQAERPHQRDELLDLSVLPVNSKTKLGGGVDDLGAEGVGEAQRLDAVLAACRAP